jgi:ABC-type sugar transport system ATPase subunit
VQVPHRAARTNRRPRGSDHSTGRDPLLECKGVTKRFGAVAALTDVDLEVYSGGVVAIVGDNGAGKSTLIKAIAGAELRLALPRAL